jgi:hypothetical protein
MTLEISSFIEKKIIMPGTLNESTKDDVMDQKDEYV